MPESRFDLHFMSCVSSGDLPFVTYSFVWWPTSGLMLCLFLSFFQGRSRIRIFYIFIINKTLYLDYFAF